MGNKNTIEYLEKDTIDTIETLDDEFEKKEQQEGNNYSYDSIKNLEDSTTENNYINYNNDEVLENREEQLENSEDNIVDEKIEDNHKEKDDTTRDVVEEEITREKKKEQKFVFNNEKIIKVVFLIACGVIIAFVCVNFFGVSDKYYGNSKYYLTSYDERNCQYKLTKQFSIYDSIIIRNTVENKDIRYDFKISNGKVIANNSYGMYELKTIQNAKQLVVTPMGDLNQFTGVFVLTNDGKFYSISLYDDNGNLITNCDELETSIKSYDFNFVVKKIEAGFYSKKDGSSTVGIILITDTDGDKHVLATKKSDK